MRDYHFEAMNEVVLEYRPDLEGPTLTSLIASAIKKHVAEEREACAKTLDDMVDEHDGAVCQRCLGIKNAARQIRERAE